MKRTLLLFILFAFFLVDGIAQSENDTVITVDQYTKYLGLTCSLREEIIKAVKERDSQRLNQLRKTILVYDYPAYEETIKDKLLTKREDIMLQFYSGEYDKLILGIKWGSDYFQKAKIGNANISVPNFECGNLTLDLLDFWKTQTHDILVGVSTSNLTTEEKELLILYWETILLYIESDRTLSPEINKKASDYLLKYPDTPYSSFVQELKGKRKVYRQGGMTIGINFGMDYPNGNIEKYFKGAGLGGLEIGAMFNNWHLRWSLAGYGLNRADTFLLERIDTNQIKSSSGAELFGAGFKIGYAVFKKGPFKLEPFVSLDMNVLNNHVEVRDSSGIRSEGIRRGYFSFGTEASLRLFRNVMRIPETRDYLYSYREEKDRFTNPLYLTLRAGYFPETFKKSTGVTGSMFYWSAGLQWVMGNQRAKYRHRK